MPSVIKALLEVVCTTETVARLAHLMPIPHELEGLAGAEANGDGTRPVKRVALAHALNMALFADLLDRVPTGRAYVDDVAAAGGTVQFDHGALRTVRWASTGALPPGKCAFTRILRPLGYRLNGTYPLTRIGMTGRSYAQQDAPEAVAQYFVSEFHPERFSGSFQETVTRVLSASEDALTPEAEFSLHELERDGHVPFEAAARLLPVILACFARQHPVPSLADYEALLKESAEMAWIATEGNAFNHATDRVSDVFAVAQAQRELGRPIKENVEVSKSGRVKQTAFRADPVEREFVGADGELVKRSVPGSFYEFITRDQAPAAQDSSADAPRLDLGFDAGNATGIFKMTAA